MKHVRPSSVRPRSGPGFRLAAVGFTALAAGGLHAQQPQRPTEIQAQQQAQPQQGIDAYVSQDAMQLLYRRKLDLGEIGNNWVRGGFFINEQRDLLALADVLAHVEGRPARRRWALEVGPRAYAALLSVENADIFAVAIGGKFSFLFGPKRMSSASATAFYAPDITTFGNANSVTDLTLQFETPLTDNMDVFAGYRWFRFDLPAQNGVDSSDRDLDKGVSLGITFRF